MAGPWEDYGPAPVTRQRPPIVDDTLTPSRAKAIWDKQSAALENKIASLPVAAKKIARDKFFADPRVRMLREVTAQPVARSRQVAVPVTTREEEIRNVARRNVERSRSPVRQTIEKAVMGPFGLLASNDFTESALASGLDTASFGLGDKLRAGLGSLVGGGSYDDLLDLAREETRQREETSTGGNVFGSLAGAVAGGVATPVKLVRGATAANAAKIAGTGAAFGAADAAGHDHDIVRGAGYGAAGALTLVGIGKGLNWLGNYAADFLKTSSAQGILRRFTNMTKEEAAARVAEAQANGLNPTVYEILPLEDRLPVANSIIGHSANTAELASVKVQSRARNVGPEMAARTKTLTDPRHQRVVAQMEADLMASAAPEAILPEQAGLPQRAADAPLDMDALASAEARNIMAPHDNRVLFNDVTDLYPQTPQLQPDGSVTMVSENPEVTSAIRSVTGSLKLRREGGITGREVSDILSELRADASGGGSNIERRNAQAAINHIEELLASEHPEMAADVERMRAAFAARSRMIEGQAEGARTRTRSEVPVGNDAASRRARNAYDTQEGAEGRFLGQRNRLLTDFGETPGASSLPVGQAGEETGIAAAGKILDPNVQQAVAGNIGSDEARALATAADLELKNMRALASVAKGKVEDANEMTPQQLGQMLVGLAPSAMPFTRFRILAGLQHFFRFSDAKAMRLTDLLLSQEPGKVKAALELLNSNSSNARKFMAQLTAAVIAGHAGASAGEFAGSPVGEESPVPQDADSLIPEAQAAEPGPWEEYAAPAEDAGPVDAGEVPYGRSVIEDLFPGVEVTDDTRDPNSRLGRKNPDSWHNHSDQAVDVRPIPGMTFGEFIAEIEAAGYTIIEAIDEVNHPSGHATGPHWHVVIA